MVIPIVAEPAGLQVGLARISSVFWLWRWASEPLLDLLDDWNDRLYWWQRSGALRFPLGMIVGLLLGAGLMGLWSPWTQHSSTQHGAEGTLEHTSITGSHAMRSNVVVEVEPLAAQLQVREPVLTVSEAVASDMIVQVEAFPGGLNSPDANPIWQVPIFTGTAPEALPSRSVPALTTPADADPTFSLPIRVQVALALPLHLLPAPTESLAADLVPSAASPVRSFRKAPVLSAPEASESRTHSVSSPVEAPSSSLDLSEIQPVEKTREPTIPEAGLRLPEPSRGLIATKPVTLALPVPEINLELDLTGPEITAPEPTATGSTVWESDTEEATTEPNVPNLFIVETELPLSPLWARVVLPATSQADAADAASRLVRPPSRNEARAAEHLEFEPAQPVQAEVPQCNIQACAAAYRSFRASDCTYQPFEGPRQLCTEEPQASDLSQSDAAQLAEARAPQCNIQRCEAAYQSFRASDCTYQPFEGGRQLCTR